MDTGINATISNHYSKVLHILIGLFCIYKVGYCIEAQNSYRDSTKPGEISPDYHIDGPFFKDHWGRTVIFHGFNAVEKSFPWYPNDLLNDTKLSLYRSWGFNVVRLGTMWTGAQPSPLYFNQTYINILTTIVEKLDEYGINVILDMHQDVLSSSLGSYDGVPPWVIKKLPPPDHPFPWPLNNITQWSDGYLTEATGTAFQAIYDNKSNASNDLAAFWKRIAQEFKQFDNVLGYELINEPWAGDIYHDITLLAPGEAGRKNLKPLYDRLNSAIREVDSDGIIFYEPVTWGIFFNGSALGSGFKSVPGGEDFANRSCLSYHYYCWVLGGSDQHKHFDSFSKTICDKTLGPLVFQAVKDDLNKTGGTSFLTEFGLCDPDGKKNSTATQECDFVMHEADKNLQSWTYWDSQFFNESGNPNMNIVEAFSRIYPRAIAGASQSFQYNPDAKVFHMDFILDTAIKATTDIFVPILHYPNGFSVHVSDGFKWYFDVASQVISVWKVETNEITINGTCSITIQPFTG